MLKFNQTAAYWEPDGTSDLYGKPNFKAPVQLACIWQDKTKLSTLRGFSYLDHKGTEQSSEAKVFFLNQPIELGGYLMLGESTEPNPYNVPEAWEVASVATTPQLRSLKPLTTAYLS